MSKITIISAVFPPEPIVSANTSYNMARGLIYQEQFVNVITNFPNRPAGKLYKGYRQSVYSTSIDPSGFRLVRCFSFFSKESSMVSRWMENISFGLSSSLALFFSPKPDAIYVNTWPIFAQGLACFVASVRRIPVVLNIQDIYPESLAMQGRLSSTNLFYKILRWIDRANARSAGALIVLSDYFAKIYTEDRGIPAEKVHVIPNWVDPDEIQLLPKAQFRKRYGISENAFVFGYAGNIGVAAGVENVIEAFANIGERKTYLLIAGDGSRRQSCQDLVKKLGAKNVIFHSPWPKEETSEVLAAADVLVLPTQGEQSMASVPSKMLNYMLAARPILALVLPDSETAQLIHAANCGWVVSPGDQTSASHEMAKISLMPADLHSGLGLAGRDYVQEHLSSEVCIPRVIQILEHAAEKGK